MNEVDRRYNCKRYPVDSATRIDSGDMVWLDTDDIKSASDFTWDTDLPTTQAAFAAVFVGVAIETSAVGETKPILVSDGRDIPHMMRTASATYQPGASVGPAESPTSKLANQMIAAAAATAAIGRVPIQVESGVGQRVPVLFGSAVEVGSANVNAQIG